jgi:SAM-dependent MidA family methyltransferase
MEHEDERWNESNAKLVERVRDAIAQSGPLRFDRFMELVLYDPEFGYYRSPDPAPGRTGDFITAPEAHPIFGAILANQVVAFDKELDHPDPFTIIEYGAGNGLLIRPLLAELRQSHGEVYERIHYRPVEVNETRLVELQAHLEAGGHKDRLQLGPLDEPVIGCVIANEFVDAFPVRRCVRENGELAEVFVTWHDGWFAETHQSTDDPELVGYINRHRFNLSEGQVVEFHPGIGDWVAEVDQKIERGQVLVIDYGYPADELFRDHRKQGTLKAYFQHGASNEPYRGIGRQDLTAHVNFSEIIWHAQQRGFQMRRLTTQAELLEELGLGERLLNLQSNPNLTADDYLAVRAAVLRMIDPGAMGRFRAVILDRNAADKSSSSTDLDSATPDRNLTSW